MLKGPRSANIVIISFSGRLVGETMISALGHSTCIMHFSISGYNIINSLQVTFRSDVEGSSMRKKKSKHTDISWTYNKMEKAN